jgi:hypothetical protein
MPIGDDTFTATLTADAAAAGLEPIVTYGTGAGEVRDAIGSPIEEGTSTYSIDLPGAERILSISFRQEGVGGLPQTLALGVERAQAGDAPLQLADWEPLRWRGSGGRVTPAGDGLRLEIDPGVGHIVGGIAPPMPPLPALVSPEISRSQGRVFEATLGGQLLTFERVGVAQHFPTVLRDFLVTSTPALLEASIRIPESGLSIGEVWASGQDPRAALERSGFVVGTARSVRPIVGALAQLPQSLAVGLDAAAAAGGLGLVVVGVAVGLYFAQRRREFEVASLRAMGAEPRQIARALLLEQGVMVVFAMLVGAGLGIGILRFVMPYVGRSIGTAFPEPVLRVDWVAMGVALTAIVAATAAGLLAALRALLRASVTGVLRGEAE